MMAKSLFAALPTLVVSTCDATREYSVKLNMDLFKDRQQALDGLYGALDGVQQQTSWFRHREHRQKKHHIEQELGFLDDAKSSFQKAGLQLRYRRRETGTNKWSKFHDVLTSGRISEIDLKYVTGIKDQADAFPDQPSSNWLSSWHCKVEGNVYSSGQVLWQATGFVLGEQKSSRLVHEYPDYWNFSSFDNVDDMFPNISAFVYKQNARKAGGPLVVTKQQHSFLQDIELWMDDVPIVATVTLVYPSHSALQAGTPLLNADFEWKAKAADSSWGEQNRSMQLMSLLGTSQYVNQSFTPPYAQAMKEQGSSPHGPVESSWQGVDVVLAATASVAMLLLLLCGHQVLKRLKKSQGNLENPIDAEGGAAVRHTTLAQTLLHNSDLNDKSPEC